MQRHMVRVAAAEGSECSLHQAGVDTADHTGVLARDLDERAAQQADAIGLGIRLRGESDVGQEGRDLFTCLPRAARRLSSGDEGTPPLLTRGECVGLRIDTGPGDLHGQYSGQPGVLPRG